MKIPCIVFGSTLRLWVLVIQSLWFFMPLCAQTALSITDTEGVPLYGAYVVLQDGNGTSAISSDENGAALIPPGWFVNGNSAVVNVSHVGYSSEQLTLDKMEGLKQVRLSLNSETLGTFVVTGQYKPSDPESTVQRIRLIDREEIEKMSPRNVSDVLANQFNVRLEQDNILGSSISMMGLSGQNIKILIDGVPVTGRQDGNIDLSQLLLNGVERIELVEGPMSVNYGTNAMAGTINIITRSNKRKESGFRFRSYAEHIGKLDLGMRVDQSRGKSTWSLDLARNYFAGWDPSQSGLPELQATVADSSRHQQWKPRTQFLGRLNYTFTDGDLKWGYKGEFLKDHILNRGLPRSPLMTSAFDETFNTYRIDNALFLEKKGKVHRFNAIIAHNIYERQRNTYFNDLTVLEPTLVSDGSLQDTNLFHLSNARFTFANTKDSALVNWELGTDLNREAASGGRIAQGEEQEILDLAVYASAEIELGKKLVARPGIRYAYNSAYDAPLTPAMNFRYRANDKYTFRLSYAQGFRSPSLKERFLYFVDVNHNIVGNEDLLPESSHNLSMSAIRSIRAESGKSSIEITGAYNEIKDLITLVGITNTEFTYRNINDVRTIAGRVAFSRSTKKLAYAFGAGLVGRKDKLGTQVSVNEFEVLELPFKYSYEVSASLTAKMFEHYQLFAQYRYQGEQYNYSLVNDVDLVGGLIGEYHLAEMNMSRTVWKNKLNLALGCKDLFDIRNIGLSGAASQPHASGADQAALTTGRTVFLQLRLNIE